MLVVLLFIFFLFREKRFYYSVGFTKSTLKVKESWDMFVHSSLSGSETKVHLH